MSRSVAFGPEGQIAAGYVRRRRGALRRPWRAAPTRAAGGQGGRCHERGLRAGGQDRRGIWRRRRGGVVLFDARGERLRPAPLEVKEGDVTSVAFGPEGQIAAGYGGGGRGGVVLFDARGERLRPAPLEVKEGDVRSVAFGPEGKIAAGYGGGGGGGGVVLFDARGERLRPAPLEVKEGDVTSVAFGPEGKIAAGYGGSVGSSTPGGGFVARRSAAWCSSTPVASGSDPRRWRSRRAMSGAWPSGRRARSPRDMASRRRRRRGALRRPGRAAPTRAAGGQGGRCQERGLRAGGPDRRGICIGGGGGVVLFDADPASWLRKAGQTANRNFTRLEWTRYFPETPYRRTIRSLPWPHDLPEAERKQAEAFEKEHPEGSDAS